MLTHEEEEVQHRRTGRLTTKQRKFLMAVSCADCDGDIWGEFSGTCPDATHDDFAELWAWAKRMHYCHVIRSVKTYEIMQKGLKALARGE